MARPVEFDRNLARDRALRLFWSRGYQGAGLTDLLDAMEIGRSSLYAAFGDKRRLFTECLDQFASRTLAVLAPDGSQRQPLVVLRHFFEQSFLTPEAEERSWGCMLVNSVVELADIDQDLRDHAGRQLQAVQASFERLLAQAGFGPDAAKAHAGYLMVVNQGLRVSSRQGLGIDDLRARITVTFDMLESAVNNQRNEAKLP